MQKAVLKELAHSTKIDILRAIAIIGVVVFHAMDCYYPHFWIKSYKDYQWIDLPNLKSVVLNFSPTAYGWTCVHFFLLISGFLIHLIYLKNDRKLDFKTYISKRFWRIYPPYLFAMFFFALATSGYSYYLLNTKGWWYIISHLLMVHNLSDTTIFEINSSFWSLALEFQFYLLYPVFLWMSRKWSYRNALLFVGSISLLTVIIGMWKPHLETIEAYRTSPARNWIIWCTGTLLAEKYFEGKKLFPKNSAFRILAIAVIAIASRAIWFTSYFTLHLASLAWLMFFEWFLYKENVNLQSRINKAAITIGLCSYSIYLIHQPYLCHLLHFFFVFYFSPEQSRAFALLNQIPAYLILFFISYSMYLFIEKPAIAYGKRLRERKTK